MPLIGFRTEDLFGEGYRDLREVVRHEVLELKNEDIIDTIKKTRNFLTNDQVFEYLKTLYKNGFKNCVWVVESIQDFIDEYDEEVFLKEDERWYAMDRYEFGDFEYEVISDLGRAGKLVAYRKRPIVVPVGQVSRSNPRGILYYGWAGCPMSSKMHYFVNGTSICLAFQHFGRPQPRSPKPFPDHRLCKTCMRLLCDKIIIYWIPVDLSPIRAYVKHLRKRRIENLGAYEYERQRLHDAIFNAAGFRSGNEDYNRARIIYRESEFGQELDHLLTRVFGCPKCKLTLNRDNKCYECGEFISVEDNLNTLERLADISRRT